MSADERRRSHANPVQEREHPEPFERDAAAPLALLLFIVLLCLCGAGYILLQERGDPARLGDHRTAALLRAQAPAASGAPDGAALYTARCAACHQAGGGGLPGVFPPLAGSEWVTGEPGRLARIVLVGVGGTLTVKGHAYSGQMPAFRDQMSDVELSAILSHVRAAFGNGAAGIDAATVAAQRRAQAARTSPWDGDHELRAGE